MDIDQTTVGGGRARVLQARGTACTEVLKGGEYGRDEELREDQCAWRTETERRPGKWAETGLREPRKPDSNFVLYSKDNEKPGGCTSL